MRRITVFQGIGGSGIFTYQNILNILCNGGLYIYITNHKKITKYISHQIAKKLQPLFGQHCTISPLILIPHFSTPHHPTNNVTHPQPKQQQPKPSIPLPSTNPHPTPTIPLLCICLQVGSWRNSNVEQLNQRMFKLPSSQQRRQKILNYQIKLIEQCSDSLFNSSTCNHSRYLQWNLQATLASILNDRPYHLRYMGSDHCSYIYTYFYITITACSRHSSSMVELKTVLYHLAEKYLSQYEQKLLIQFLCLIQYSQEKYLFFRKYNKIEGILVKLLQEVERRNRVDGVRSLRNTVQDMEGFSKLTTGITSPCKSMEKDREDGKGMVVVRKNYGRRFAEMFEIYSKHFRFVKIEYLCENVMKFGIDLERAREQEYYVCIEKECFFVVEVQHASISHISKRSCSIIEEERQQMMKKGKKSSKVDSKVFQHKQKRSGHQHDFTPKFISDRKKRSLADQDFYNNQQASNKNINIEVLQVNNFQEKQPSIVYSNQAILHYKSKIEHLGNIKNTIHSIDLDKSDNFTNHNANAFGVGMQRKVQTEQTINKYQKHYTQNNDTTYSKRYVPNIKKHTSFKGQDLAQIFKPSVHNQKDCTTTGYGSTQKINPQNITKTIRSGNFSRETLLSGNMLKGFKEIKPMGKLPARQFHSHSPRNRLIEMRPDSNYHHFASPLKNKDRVRMQFAQI